jgi:hypothetical protein
MPTLSRISTDGADGELRLGMPVEEFWKRYDAGEFGGIED